MSQVTWKVVAGVSLNKRTLSEWGEKQYVTFLRFCEFFIVVKNGVQTLAITKERWRESEEFLKDDHPYQEFLYRINLFSFDKGATEKKFAYKLMNMMRVVLGYLRENPALITPTLKEIIEPNPRFNWCLKQTKIVTTKSGFDVVVPDNAEPLGEGRGPVGSVATHQQKLIESMNRVTNVMDMLANSITPEEIKKMSAKDRLAALARMSFVFGLSKSVKPSKNIFKQIKIQVAGREELEEAMLIANRDE